MTVRKEAAARDNPVCGAKKRQGEGDCTRPAGWGTDHVGQGRCKLHGGSNPIKHGRYSKVTRPRIAELLRQFEDDPDPLDLLPEVQLLRALIIDFIERYDEYVAALLAWHKDNDTYTFTDQHGNEHERVTEKPHQIVDILSVGKFITAIGSLAERIEKQRKEGTITIATLDRVIEQHGVELMKAAQEAIPDVAQREALFTAVERRWGTIALDLSSPKGTAGG